MLLLCLLITLNSCFMIEDRLIRDILFSLFLPISTTFAVYTCTLLLFSSTFSMLTILYGETFTRNDINRRFCMQKCINIANAYCIICSRLCRQRCIKSSFSRIFTEWTRLIAKIIVMDSHQIHAIFRMNSMHFARFTSSIYFLGYEFLKQRVPCYKTLCEYGLMFMVVDLTLHVSGGLLLEAVITRA